MAAVEGPLLTLAVMGFALFMMFTAVAGRKGRGPLKGMKLISGRIERGDVVTLLAGWSTAQVALTFLPGGRGQIGWVVAGAFATAFAVRTFGEVALMVASIAGVAAKVYAFTTTPSCFSGIPWELRSVQSAVGAVGAAGLIIGCFVLMNRLPAGINAFDARAFLTVDLVALWLVPGGIDVFTEVGNSVVGQAGWYGTLVLGLALIWLVPRSIVDLPGLALLALELGLLAAATTGGCTASLDQLVVWTLVFAMGRLAAPVPLTFLLIIEVWIVSTMW